MRQGNDLSKRVSIVYNGMNVLILSVSDQAVIFSKSNEVGSRMHFSFFEHIVAVRVYREDADT